MSTQEQKQGFTATQEEIDAWKKRHGSVYLLEVEGYNAYVKAPGRNEISYATTIAKQDPMKFNSAILDKCWLAGDEEIKHTDRLFMGAASQLDQIIEIAEATIKKL